MWVVVTEESDWTGWLVDEVFGPFGTYEEARKHAEEFMKANPGGYATAKEIIKPE